MLHGYRPGTVRPTTELVLSHKHPADYQQVAATLDEMRRARQSFSTRHRIIDTDGDVHEVVVIGDQLKDDDGRLIGTHGFYVDVTPTAETTKAFVTEALAEITENHSVIEQVKGMLMLIYRVDAQTAFELLRWRSQETNVELRPLADQLLADYTGLAYGERMPPRAAFDHLLLTAHQRIQFGSGTGDTLEP